MLIGFSDHRWRISLLKVFVLGYRESREAVDSSWSGGRWNEYPALAHAYHGSPWQRLRGPLVFIGSIFVYGICMLSRNIIVSVGVMILW